jgi:hypothetical protein
MEHLHNEDMNNKKVSREDLVGIPDLNKLLDKENDEWNVRKTKVREKYEDETCAICLNNLVLERSACFKVKGVTCHIFCYDCINEWFITSKTETCPMCRKECSMLFNPIQEYSYQKSLKK